MTIGLVAIRISGRVGPSPALVTVRNFNLFQNLL